MIRRCGFHEEAGDQKHGEPDRDARKQFFRRGHDRMKPCSRSAEHSRPKIWRNSEDSVAAFGQDEGRSATGVLFLASGQIIVSYGSPTGRVQAKSVLPPRADIARVLGTSEKGLMRTLPISSNNIVINVW
jgi:hypothetical protein